VQRGWRAYMLTCAEARGCSTHSSAPLPSPSAQVEVHPACAHLLQGADALCPATLKHGVAWYLQLAGVEADSADLPNSRALLAARPAINARGMMGLVAAQVGGACMRAGARALLTHACCWGLGWGHT